MMQIPPMCCSIYSVSILFLQRKPKWIFFCDCTRLLMYVVSMLTPNRCKTLYIKPHLTCKCCIDVWHSPSSSSSQPSGSVCTFCSALCFSATRRASSWKEPDNESLTDSWKVLLRYHVFWSSYCAHWSDLTILLSFQYSFLQKNK